MTEISFRKVEIEKMPIYEVTAIVPDNVLDSWLQYMKSHVKDLIDTKCFEKAAMQKVLDTEENSFVISYTYKTEADFEGM